jgi:hypothetical protein
MFARKNRPLVRTVRPTIETLEDRLVLNNRFIVPFGQANNVTSFSNLQAALAKPGLLSGDVIEIEQGANPGAFTTAMLPHVPNLTIQGQADIRPENFMNPIEIDQDLDINAADQGLTFKHVRFNVYGGRIQFLVAGTITDSFLDSSANPNDPQQTDVRFLGGAGELSNSTLIHETFNNSGVFPESILDVVGSGVSTVKIIGNTFRAGPSLNDGPPNQNIAVINYYHQLTGLGVENISKDVIARNDILAYDGFTGDLLDCNGAAGLTLANNDFASETSSSIFGIRVNTEPGSGVEPVDIHGNKIDLREGTALSFEMGQKQLSAVGTPVTTLHLVDNVLRTGGPDAEGAGLLIQLSDSTKLQAKIEGNDFNGNDVGVAMGWSDAGLGDLDLGGGDLGSLGGNNFRTYYKPAGPVGGAFSGAIVVNTNTNPAAVTVTAHADLFYVDPETVIYDSKDGQGSVKVAADNPLAGNAAYVESLYLHFLHRPADTTNLGDAGGWVNQLNLGVNPATVVKGIARSFEAYLYQATQLYWKYLGRQGDIGELTTTASGLLGGATLESVAASLVSSAEYAAHYVSDRDYVESLYGHMLDRSASPSEINGWLTLMQQGTTRAGVAAAFLSTPEYRTLVMDAYYHDFLHRIGDVDPGEIAGAVASGLDEYSLGIALVGSPEFVAIG